MPRTSAWATTGCAPTASGCASAFRTPSSTGSTSAPSTSRTRSSPAGRSCRSDTSTTSPSTASRAARSSASSAGRATRATARSRRAAAGLQRLNVETTFPGQDLEYAKATYKHQWYIPVTKDYTLALNADVGYGRSLGDKSYPVFKNFYAGGINSVRGFSPNSLGPRDPVDNLPIGGQRALRRQRRIPVSAARHRQRPDDPDVLLPGRRQRLRGDVSTSATCATPSASASTGCRRSAR